MTEPSVIVEATEEQETVVEEVPAPVNKVAEDIATAQRRM